ncbi:MAG: MarR family transcriptional regulator [Gammaproteobacteria bacterium]|nr:MarR family transcriptional regulator [Gammaproteobacteria bacterium]
MKLSSELPSGQRGAETSLETLIDACRENSTATVLFHGAIADRIGLGPTDHKTLDVLLRRGPLTAGEIAAHTGLASGSVTNLIDRLEAKGFVCRTDDPRDRRRVIVQPVPERVAELAVLFDSLKAGVESLMARYDEIQLATIVDFLESTAALLRDETIRLTAKDAAQG